MTMYPLKRGQTIWAVVALLTALVFSAIPHAVRAASNYAIQPGDTLHVEVLEDPTLNRDLLVLPDGTISFPYMGSFMIGGKTVDQVKSEITHGIAPNFVKRPTVYVSINRISRPMGQAGQGGVNVFLMGEIAKPGKIKVSSGTTLLQAVAEAGGTTKFAADRRLELHRHDPKTGKDMIYTFSVTDTRAKGRDAIPATTELQPGDVIVVPTRHLFE
ncbi:MAG: polysaccharide biosynthesis/export family protein [Paracoccaceae bacterium]|nr:polysaccharide biosynthesis/export family protein [Paracoccaceae bacterium]MDE3238668.1 polysaccharide biosynthesis/export family protein [Paracoccaceae bacterium]